jgi:hypothetical protein
MSNPSLTGGVLKHLGHTVYSVLVPCTPCVGTMLITCASVVSATTEYQRNSAIHRTNIVPLTKQTVHVRCRDYGGISPDIDTVDKCVHVVVVFRIEVEATYRSICHRRGKVSQICPRRP